MILSLQNDRFLQKILNVEQHPYKMLHLLFVHNPIHSLVQSKAALSYLYWVNIGGM